MSSVSASTSVSSTPVSSNSALTALLRSESGQQNSKMLDRAEEVALIAQAQAGHQPSIDRLIAAFGPLLRTKVAKARKMALGLFRSMDSFDEADLMQVAILELLVRLPGYDASKNTAFYTYIEPYLKTAVTLSVLQGAGPTRVGTNVYDKKALRTARVMGLGRLDLITEKDAAEVAQRAGIPIASATRITRHLSVRHVRLHAGSPDADDARTTSGFNGRRFRFQHHLLERASMDAFHTEGVFQQIEDRKDAEFLHAAIAALPDARLREIVVARMGDAEHPPMEFTQIAAHHGMTPHTVRKLYLQGAQFIRQFMTPQRPASMVSTPMNTDFIAEIGQGAARPTVPTAPVRVKRTRKAATPAPAAVFVRPQASVTPSAPVLPVASPTEIARQQAAYDGSDGALIALAQAHGLIDAELEATLRALRASACVQVGNLVVFRDGSRVSVAGQDLPLTKKQIRLLSVLAEHINRPVSRMYLADCMDITPGANETIVNVYVCHLRKVLQAAGFEGGQICTVFGSGYLLRSVA